MFKPKDFDKSQVGNYTKMEDGANKIRVLEPPITGYVYWEDVNGNIVPRNEMAGKGGKPVRAPDYDDFSNLQKGAMRGFAAMVVWNYQADKVQILEVRQIVIINALEALTMSKSWQDVTEFDIIITKTRTGTQPTDVEYSVMPEPKEELSEEIKDAFKNSNIDIKALFRGADPFGSEEPEVDVEAVDLGDLDAPKSNKKRA